MKKILSFLFLSIPFLAFGQFPIEKIQQAYANLVADEQAKYAITSLCVLDAQTGKIVFANNENVGLATASTLKTITAATAFSLLGKDFKYQTTLAYSGKITTDGTLQGDLTIIGSGDPTLGSWRYEQTKENIILNQWVNAVKNAGIKKVEGSVVGYDNLFGTQTMPEGWVWQDMGNYYGAGGSSLNWRENQFDIHLKPGAAIGDEVKINNVVPTTPHIKIVNELKTGASGTGDRTYGFLPPYGDVAYLRGTWGIGINKAGVSLSVPDPAFEAAYRLQDTLQKLGIQITNEATTSRRLNLDGKLIAKEYKSLSAVNSPSLSEIIYWFNKKSINLYGEQLLKTIAWKQGKAPSTKNGSATVINFWAGKGIDPNALNILDGSGLSPGIRVTTLAMASILFQVQKEDWFPEFYKSLPEYNGMKIKSGSINDVAAFAGYHTDKIGNKYVVVININNYSGSGINKKLFKVLDALK